jgi:hypothetical protein
MGSYSDIFANYITRVRGYLAEPDPVRSRWTNDFLKQLFNAAYRRRVTQLIMAYEGAFENEVSMPVLTSGTVYTSIPEPFEQLITFTALNAQSTISVDSAIKQQGFYSLNLNKASGNATVGFTKTYPASFSMSTSWDNKAYFYYYALNNSLLTSSGLVVKLGYDSTNYFQWTTNPTLLTTSAWNLITLDLSTPTSITGAPNLSALTYLEVNLVFSASGTVQTGYKFDKLYFEEKPNNLGYYPWPTGFERMSRLELETVEGRRIPLSRDERAARSFSTQDNGFSSQMPTYRPVQGGFVLEPPLNSASSIQNVIVGYVGTPPLLVNDNERLGSDFPVSYDELLVLDTALAAMDSESLLEGGAIKSILRTRMEWQDDYERYIDGRISALRRIELADSYYEDA